MKVIIAFAALVVALTAEKVSYEGYKVYRIEPTGNKQLEALLILQNNRNVDFWSTIRKNGGPIDVMVKPNFLHGFVKYLQKFSIKYQVLIDNVARVVEEEVKHRKMAPKVLKGKITFTQYHTHNEINNYLDKLVVDYPNSVTTQIIGQSYENRDLKLIKITKNISDDTPKPIIFIDAGIHAREWIAPPVALYIIHQLVENATNAHMTDNVDWHILPVLNPDGYQFTHADERFWRKTRSPGNDLCAGTDGNRNFDFHWGEIGASTDPCDETYQGSVAFSEKETQAIRDYVEANKENMKLYITYHSYGPYILYPWGYTEELPEDSAQLHSLAEQVNDAIVAAGGPSYIIGSSTNALYAAAGGSDDWVKGVGGVQLSYTIELPGGGFFGFDPPPTDILPTVKQMWEGIKVYHQHISGNPTGGAEEDGDSATVSSPKVLLVFLASFMIVFTQVLFVKL